MSEVKISNSWFAGPREMLKCPVEGCTHVGMVITKVHCKLEHGITRDQVLVKYGMPTIVVFDMTKMQMYQIDLHSR